MAYTRIREREDFVADWRELEVTKHSIDVNINACREVIFSRLDGYGNYLHDYMLDIKRQAEELIIDVDRAITTLKDTEE